MGSSQSSTETPASDIGIFIFPTRGVKFRLRVDANDTVKNVKAKIELREGIRIAVQLLADPFGYLMEDSHTLSNYNVVDGSTLILSIQDTQDVSPRLTTASAACEQDGRLLDQSVQMKSPQTSSPTTPCDMKIYVKTLTGRIHTLQVDPCDTVWSVKSKLYLLEGIEEDQQRLFFCGQHMDNGDTLSDYNIYNDALIHFVLRPRGS